MDLDAGIRRHWLAKEASTCLRTAREDLWFMKRWVSDFEVVIRPDNYAKLKGPLLERMEDIRRKWVSRVSYGVRLPKSTEVLEKLVEEIRQDFCQGPWMLRGLKLAADACEETDRWLDSLDGPMTPEMFYDRYPEVRTTLAIPFPPSRCDVLRERLKIASAKGEYPYPSIPGGEDEAAGPLSGVGRSPDGAVSEGGEAFGKDGAGIGHLSATGGQGSRSEQGGSGTFPGDSGPAAGSFEDIPGISDSGPGPGSSEGYR
ncbi:MAG: hypothetical protein LBT40_03110 [Deltaproteobacteria bacterium]|nr:hypothetical protein [Deltaproteobacteria bacterium]